MIRYGGSEPLHQRAAFLQVEDMIIETYTPKSGSKRLLCIKEIIKRSGEPGIIV
jgi:hypothetical protein